MTTSVGVLVARFQGQKLHEGWRDIIDEVGRLHETVLIVLGVHGGLRTKRDPLTFEERAYMVREAYPEIHLAALKDNPFSHQWWSEDLDGIIAKMFPGIPAILYGSRDSFIPLHSGIFPTRSITPKIKYSGTELRAEALMPTTEEGRAAIIFAERERPAMVYSTVDVAITDVTKSSIILITKKVYRGFWSLPGGFAEPDGTSDLEDATRERSEEVVDIDIGELTCLTPNRVRLKDPRYRGSFDGTRTNLYHATYLGGTPRAGDDADDARWFDMNEIKDVLVPWHQPLREILESRI